jgi:hypothetical protein
MSPTQEPKIWFTLLEGEQHGPYTFTAVVQAAESGRLDLEDHVCRLGWGEWRIARDVPGLFKQEPEPAAVDQEQNSREKGDGYFDDPLEQDIGNLDDSRAEDDGNLVERAQDGGNLDDYAPTGNLKKDDRDTVRKAAVHGNVWIVMFSVLAVLVVLFGAGWIATLLGLIRVTLLF